MSVSTYGIAPPVRGPRVSGPSLLQIGSATRDAGMSTAAAAAGAEQQRTLTNDALKQEHKAGMVQLGSTLGSIGGFVAGTKLGEAYGGKEGAAFGAPWGAMLGSSLGAIAGGAF